MNKIIILLLISVSSYSQDCGFVVHNDSLYALKNNDSVYLPVVYLIGQSNMEGGDTATANTQEQFKASFDIPTYVNGLRPKNIQYGVSNNFRSPTKYFGAECPLAYYMGTKKIGIIKYAYGGSQLVDTKYRVQGYWQTDSDSTHGRKNYDTLIQKFVTPGIAAFKWAKYKPYTIALVVSVGESDAQDSVAAYNYQYQLTRLFDKFKADAGNDSMSFIIIKTHPINASYKYMNIVRQAQENIAATYPNCYLINGDSWPVTYDHIHWTREAQGFSGKTISDILTQLIK